MNFSQKKLSIAIIVPCFNEEECIASLLCQLHQYCARIDSFDWSIIFINDGSTDATESLILEQIQSAERYCFDITLINLSRNFGKEAALIAGFDNFSADACILMDADLQDPPDLIPAMVSSWQDGYHIVTAKRKSRGHDTWAKKLGANLFYRLFRVVSKLDIELDASDFRLLDKSVVQAIKSCRESVRFSKGFFAWTGFKTSLVTYVRPERFRGGTKWGNWKLWNYGLDGIFNFSTAPLRIWSYIGFLVTLISFSLGLFAVFNALINGVDVPGYSSIFVAITFLGGIQLIGIGVLGEYIGRIYIESKKRPIYLVRSIENNQKIC